MGSAFVRRLVAEVIGTAMLVTFGAGSVVAALIAGGGIVDYPALGMIALAFGLAIAVAIYTFGTTSGAHINPSVTLALAVSGRFPWAEVGPYIAAQLVGAFGGGLLIIAAFGSGAADFSAAGGTALGPGVTWGQGVTAEAIGTFLLVIAVMALAVDRRVPSGWAGLMIGLAVTGAILFAGTVSGGSLNPARTFGPYLAAAIFGGSVPWSQYWIYVVGPLLGAAAAVATYEFVTRPEPLRLAPQGTEGVIVGRHQPVPGEAAGVDDPSGARDATARPDERPG